MKSKPLWLLPVAGLGIGLAVSLLALVPLWLSSRREPSPAMAPPLPEASTASTSSLQTDGEGLKTIDALSDSERRSVIGAMAQAYCLQKQGTEGVAEAAAQVLREKGISPSVALDDDIQKEALYTVGRICP